MPFQKGHKTRVGMKHSEEARRNISLGHLGIKVSDKTKEKLRIANTGRKHTDESRKKMSLSQKGRIITEQHRQQARIAHLGMKDSEETKKKKSEIAKARGFGGWNICRKASEETKRKKSESLKKAYKEGRMKGNKGTKLSIKQRLTISERMKGSNAPNYKGGITPTNMRLRGCTQYKQWREAVYKRDNYTCIECEDSRGGNLEPDHIIAFSNILAKIRFQYGVENLYENALKCELLWDVSNGRTLCKDCHRKTNTWGNKSNNIKDEVLKLSPYFKV